jgi:hypothetical protein
MTLRKDEAGRMTSQRTGKKTSWAKALRAWGHGVDGLGEKADLI